MVQTLASDVYIEEQDQGSAPIIGVPMSYAGIVGSFPRGPVNTPTFVAGDRQLSQMFGTGWMNSYSLIGAQGFFANGGAGAYICRVVGTGAAKSKVVLKDQGTSPVDTIEVEAINEGEWGDGITVEVADASIIGRFKLIFREGMAVEAYDNLVMTATDPDYFVTRINDSSKKSNLVRVVDKNSITPEPKNRPEVISATFLAGGADGTAPTDSDYIGVVNPDGSRTGIRTFEQVDDAGIMCVPGVTSQAVHQALLDHCTTMHDRFAILEVPEGSTVEDARTYRDQFDSNLGALYFPWVELNDTYAGRLRMVPPSGHVAGVYARTDAERGIHKAPANEPVRGVLWLEYAPERGERELLQQANINLIKYQRGMGIRVWTARTLSSNPLWMYVPVRRYFLYVEKSLKIGSYRFLQEPNDENLWNAIIRSYDGFLYREWDRGRGALKGETKEDAYYIKCDAELNTPAVIDAGQTIVEVGLAVKKPAEFIVIRFNHKRDDGISIED